MSDSNSIMSRRNFLRNGAVSVAALALAPSELCRAGIAGIYSNDKYARVILGENSKNGINTFTQNMISRVNTIYVVQYDFELTENITIPANCVLEFEGGSIGGNYSIIGTNTCIKAGLERIFDTNITLDGAWNLLEVYPEWFGAKGDFDVSLKKGSDDSNAINKAISVAEKLNIRKVRFSNVNYLVSKGIIINYGDIWLEGSGALLRESVGENNALVSRGGGLFCPKNQNLITFATTLIAPIRISNLQFFCYEGIVFPAYNKLDITNSSVALHFKASQKEIVWPFIVEYCHFEGFKKAIYFNSANDYCVNKVQISNTSFMYNYYCVKFNNKNNNCTWSFSFKNNCAHGNVMILDIKVCYGPCVIEDNNIEGDRISSSATEKYVTKIIIDSGSLSFKHNHSEGNNKTILNLCPMGTVRASIKHNKTTINNDACINRCDISYISSGSLYVENCDLPVFVKEYPIFKSCLLLNSTIDIQINQDSYGDLIIYTTTPYNYAKKEYINTKHVLYTNDTGYRCKFVNGVLVKNRKGCYVDYNFKRLSPTSKTGKSSYMMVALYNPEGFVKAEEIISLLHPQEGIIVRTANVGAHLKYCYFIAHRKTYKGNYYFLRENVTTQFLSSVCVADFLFPSDINVFTSLFDFSMCRNNVVDSIKSLTDSQQIIGDKVFDSSLNKELIWTGSAWVDSTGKKV